MTGPAAGRPQCRGERVLAGGAVAGHGGRLGAHALEHTQSGDQVGGDTRGVRGPFLLGLAASFERPADAVAEPQQRRDAQQDEQSERDGDPQQRHRADHQCGGRRDPVRQDGRHRTHPAGVIGGDAGERAGQPVGVGAAARIEHPGAELHPEPVRGVFPRTLGEPGARAVAVRQHQEQPREHQEPTQQRLGGAGGHRRVDGRADDDGHQGLTALVHRAEQGRGDDSPPLPSDRPAEDVPPVGPPTGMRASAKSLRKLGKATLIGWS